VQQAWKQDVFFAGWVLDDGRAYQELCAACVDAARCLPRQPAQANGAFPDSMGILLPVDQPNVIIATTNFGLLVSEDAGATFGWICEEAIGTRFLAIRRRPRS
jgi:hypothetical protein